MDFIAKVKCLMEEKGCIGNISQFEKTCGLSNGTVRNWEKGAVPGADSVIKVAKYFGVSSDYLLDLPDSPVIVNGQLTGIGVVKGQSSGAVGVVNIGTPVKPDDRLELPDISELKIISIWRKLNLKGQGELMVSLHTISSDETNLVK